MNVEETYLLERVYKRKLGDTTFDFLFEFDTRTSRVYMLRPFGVNNPSLFGRGCSRPQTNNLIEYQNYRDS